MLDTSNFLVLLFLKKKTSLASGQQVYFTSAYGKVEGDPRLYSLQQYWRSFLTSLYTEYTCVSVLPTVVEVWLMLQWFRHRKLTRTTEKGKPSPSNNVVAVFRFFQPFLLASFGVLVAVRVCVCFLFSLVAMSVQITEVYLVPSQPTPASVQTKTKSVAIVAPQRSNSLDYLNFEEKRQIIASSLSLSDFLHVGNNTKEIKDGVATVIVGRLSEIFQKYSYLWLYKSCHLFPVYLKGSSLIYRCL